eukprot:scaffold23961_cov131-Isochrysis_galbana.AAC.3
MERPQTSPHTADRQRRDCQRARIHIFVLLYVQQDLSQPHSTQCHSQLYNGQRAALCVKTHVSIASSPPCPTIHHVSRMAASAPKKRPKDDVQEEGPSLPTSVHRFTGSQTARRGRPPGSE